MKELALHLLDIVENSARAGADRVDLRFRLDGSRLAVELADNGPGLPPSMADAPWDPFRTTRVDRGVGLGLPLLRQAVEQAGGRFSLHSASPGGVRIRFEYDLAHIDAKPLGDLAGFFVHALLAWPEMRITVTLQDEIEPRLDSAEILRALDGLEPTHPRVQAWLAKTCAEAFAPLCRFPEGDR